MKLVRKQKDGSTAEIKITEKKSKAELPPWKVLIVDDEPDIHTMTELGLKDFQFADRPLHILQAMSGLAAQEILKTETNIAVALIDVVMETDDAGLHLINFIRNELNNKLIRLIIRTGQPGMAPEREVIEHYDVDDYKSKTELRADKLYTTMRVALKSYRDLVILDSNRKALRKILEAVPEFQHAQSLNQFFNGVLTQLISLCNLGENSLIYTIENGLVITATQGDPQITVRSGVGRFASTYQELEEIRKTYLAQILGETNEQMLPAESLELDRIRNICLARMAGKSDDQALPAETLLLPLEVNDQLVGFVYLENTCHLTLADLDLIQIMVQQCASALESLQLYFDLKESHQKVSQLLEIAEQARQEAEIANHAKTQFLANVSHELRTPLNSILGHAYILQRDTRLIAEQQEVVSTIHRSSEHLLTLVNDILEISKLSTDQLQPSEVCLTQLLNDLVGIFRDRARQQGLIFQYQPAACLPIEIIADGKRLRQILLNLLSNAIKFTQQGQVTFRVYSDLCPERKGWHHFHFMVSDSGCGISPDDLEKIFAPFEQVNEWQHKSAGVGLGLTLTKQWVELMDGFLEVSSQLGQGSTFTVHLDFKVSIEAGQPMESSLVKSFQTEEQAVLLQGPSTEKASKLYELTLMGDFQGILKLVKELEQENTELKPFVARVRELAKDYQDEAIEKLAQQFMTV